MSLLKTLKMSQHSSIKTLGADLKKYIDKHTKNTAQRYFKERIRVMGLKPQS